MHMTADGFISKWQAAELKERSAAQEHFIDLCHLLDEPTPADADPSGTFYAFERGALKTTGGEGWADVWKRGHFGWEYKGKRKDLNAAFVHPASSSLRGTPLARRLAEAVPEAPSGRRSPPRSSSH